ncbi:MAG: tRNA pseudouridine(55) synthase TruB [Deltaproteobacteria bacterium]|nr:tRNA pseudouridine(55) synthase TruB [Deltaproteobacteria bacterium]
MIGPSFLVVDKAPGLTSHDVVAMVRAVTGLRKVGHTGTLDPFARGVLPLALGAATRLVQFLDESEKVYDATIALGAATDTGDPTGRVIREVAVPPLDPERIRTVLEGFVGERLQRPPRFSAVKVQGRRLYEYARQGVVVEAQPRPIRIHGLALTEVRPDAIRVLLTCSRGTYARGLADEIAEALGTAGHLEALTRTRSGPFLLEHAISLSRLSELAAGTPDWERALRPHRGEERVPWLPREEVHAGLEPSCLRPVDALVGLPLLPVAHSVADVILRGGPLPAPPPGIRPGGRFLVVAADVAVAVAESRGGGRSLALWRASTE